MTNQTTPISIRQTPSLVGAPSIDFRKNDFEAAIHLKGYDVIHETALQCPCKGKNSNQLSDCKNCGGVGWVYINPVKTRAILHSMNMETQYKEWSKENRGTVSISVRDVERLSYMDRLSVLDGEAIFGEVLHFNRSESDVLFAFTSYNLKSILYAGLFIEADEKLQRLIETEDFTFENNIIYLDSKYLSLFEEKDGDLSITLRYIHAPQYYVIDLVREVMVTIIKEKGQDKSVSLPVSAVGRRGHYVLDAENLSKTRLLDNSYIDDPCRVVTKTRC